MSLMGIIVILFLGLIFLMCAVVQIDVSKYENKEHKKLDITQARIKEAKRMLNTMFFNRVKDAIIEKIRNGISFDYMYISKDGVYAYEDLNDYGSYTGEVCMFADLGYRNLTAEEITILYIALQSTGYFKYVVEINGVYKRSSARLKVAKPIKTYKQMEEERKAANRRRNLKDIY